MSKTLLSGQERIVIDNNVIISGALWGGKPQKIFNFVIERKLFWFVSTKQINELTRVVNYSKFKLDYVKQQEILDFVYNYSQIIDTRKNLRIIKEDPSDNFILECAYESNANFIISGDRHLLELKQFKRTKILSPSQFLDLHFV